jgi:hypothetical protein
MVHFTCDLCGKDLTASGDQRYVVKIEAFAGFDPNEIKEEDLDQDHMEAVSQILQGADDGPGVEDLAVPVRKGFRFDLCPACHVKFLKDPLGKEFLRSFDFSKN